MRLVEADEVKKALRNRISENIDECINNVPTVDVLDKIRAEISEYKDNKIIHAERNELIDIVLDIIDKYRNEVSE